MTTITLNNTHTDVRGGGYGSRAWIARIVGTDSKYGLAREFCKSDKSGLSGSGRSGVISFEVNEPGIYEFRGFCVGSTARNWEWSGFIELTADGAARELMRAEVLARVKAAA